VCDALETLSVAGGKDDVGAFDTCAARGLEADAGASADDYDGLTL